MIDFAFFAHACISCAILGGLGAGWNAIAGTLGGLGGVLSPGGAGDGGQGGSPAPGGDSEGAPSRQSAGGDVPPPAYTGPGSSTITPNTPTTATGPDGRPHYFDPSQPPASSGMNPPKSGGKGTGSGGHPGRR